MKIDTIQLSALIYLRDQKGRPHCQSLQHTTGKEQLRIEFQGTPYDDSSNKILGKNNLFLGK